MKKKVAGWIILAIGILCLITGIVLAFQVGGRIVTVFLGGSILINTVAILLLRTESKEG